MGGCSHPHGMLIYSPLINSGEKIENHIKPHLLSSFLTSCPSVLKSLLRCLPKCPVPLPRSLQPHVILYLNLARLSCSIFIILEHSSPQYFWLLLFFINLVPQTSQIASSKKPTSEKLFLYPLHPKFSRNHITKPYKLTMWISSFSLVTLMT